MSNIFKQNIYWSVSLLQRIIKIIQVMEHSNTWTYNLWVKKTKNDSVNWRKRDLVQVWLEMFFQQSMVTYLQSYLIGNSVPSHYGFGTNINSVDTWVNASRIYIMLKVALRQELHLKVSSKHNVLTKSGKELHLSRVKSQLNYWVEKKIIKIITMICAKLKL